ncbi:hypothetical protein RIR_jg986.t2 [Rhizophagus irregularis DAOM 181602=DAOM 197198]|nr:hypothetical protein RIR_jg986.t2 [Rhizophagus irregularis DAOM 181602=DAOM 197198]
MVQKLRADSVGVMLSFNELTNVLNQNLLSIILITSEGEAKFLKNWLNSEKSSFWSEFEEKTDQNGKKRFQCKYCDTEKAMNATRLLDHYNTLLKLGVYNRY